MKYLAMIFLFLRGLSASGAFDPKKVPWLASLKEEKLFFFHVCGSSEILPTQKSLNRDFLLGSKKDGYFFTEAPGISEYQAVIRDYRLKDARNTLRQRFEKSHLWRYAANELEDLGTPTKISLPFLATIKDCMVDGYNSLGLVCSTEHRDSCCSMKFAGSNIYWGSNSEFVLRYSPDPSVRLAIKGEKNHRYCNFQQILEVAGSGR